MQGCHTLRYVSVKTSAEPFTNSSTSEESSHGVPHSLYAKGHHKHGRATASGDKQERSCKDVQVLLHLVETMERGGLGWGISATSTVPESGAYSTDGGNWMS